MVQIKKKSSHLTRLRITISASLMTEILNSNRKHLNFSMIYVIFFFQSQKDKNEKKENWSIIPENRKWITGKAELDI